MMAAASVTSNMNQNNSYHYVTSSQANPQQQLPTAAAYNNAAAVAAAAGTPQTIFYVSPNVSTFDILLLLYSYIVWYIIVKRRTAEYVMSAGFSGHHVFTYYLDVSEDSNMIFTKVEILPTIFFIAFFF